MTTTTYPQPSLDIMLAQIKANPTVYEEMLAAEKECVKLIGAPIVDYHNYWLKATGQWSNEERLVAQSV